MSRHLENRPSHVVITGVSGAGKSAVARQVADRPACPSPRRGRPEWAEPAVHSRFGQKHYGWRRQPCPPAATFPPACHDCRVNRRSRTRSPVPSLPPTTRVAPRSPSAPPELRVRHLSMKLGLTPVLGRLSQSLAHWRTEEDPWLTGSWTESASWSEWTDRTRRSKPCAGPCVRPNSPAAQWRR